MHLRLWPRSLAVSTAVTLLAGLIVVQASGLWIQALDRVDLLRLAQARNVATDLMGIYRSVVRAAPEDRTAVLSEIVLPPGLSAGLQPAPRLNLQETPPLYQRLIRGNMAVVPMPGFLRPREVRMLGGPQRRLLEISLRMPDGGWLQISARLPAPRLWQSRGFLLAFVLMAAAAAGLTLWAVRRLTLPAAALAAAADRLGRDVNAPPLPEEGPVEISKAAKAFNLMALRMRRFVQDRTFLLTSIGHDLRTPITRLKLRAEFIEDEEMRHKLLADLDEMEAMVSATLVFGRDTTGSEPVVALDLAVLARTVLDEAADARPDFADRLRYDGPEHLTVSARSIALKRALSNLVANAVSYGGGALVTLARRRDDTITVEVEDRGPGVPPEEIERVFEPFHRGETSRNNETGGAGLGLPIARNILRAHGGDVTIANRPGGGVRATMWLPA